MGIYALIDGRIEKEKQTLEDILPTNFSISPTQRQNILMYVPCLRTPKHRWPERPIAHNLHLHATAHGLGNTVRPTQRLHLHGILGLAPRRQTGFERVCGRWDLGFGGG